MERNITLDYFKLFLSILVITIHIQPLFEENSIIGWLISNGIARVAVPCFFIISGYFIYEKLSDNTIIKKYLFHLFIIYLVWSLIYLPTYYDSVELRSIVTFIIFGYYHLWFLPALISGTFFLMLACKYFKNDKYIILSSLFLYLTGSFIEQYCNISYRVYCNGLFFGYPYIAIGYYLHKKHLNKIKNESFFYILLFGSFFFLLFQAYQGYIESRYINMFVALYIFCPTLFIFIIICSKYSKYNLMRSDLSKLSSAIYYVHILVINELCNLNITNNMYKLPQIILLSLLLSIFIIYLNKRIKIFL